MSRYSASDFPRPKPGPIERFLRWARKRFGLEDLISESVLRAQRASKMGRDAEEACRPRSTCPFQDTPGQAMERASWMRGYNQSARDRRPATS